MMLVYAHQLLKFTLSASDGEIGSVKDVYFDDHNWTLRYFVVDTGNWLFQRKVLISPVAVDGGQQVSQGKLPVKLSKEQVKDSPDIDMDMPVSRQQESSLFDYYSWPSNGRAGMGYPTSGMLKGASAFYNKIENQANFDPHLRSFRHVSQYEVHNEEGLVGRVKDLLIDTADWSVPYLVLDGVFASGSEHVAIPTDKILSIDWDTYTVNVSVKNAELSNDALINL
ncbi:PRC-barrel domain-containing protein [Pedobacter deserti]|uniref:PRC-barrel domain-containing protein n=1 Tax=Pedobacter deserti TaxID=2817382 RepID=UPI00210B56E4|nr:PRC-barrel domain-containing protein [Pedobacter sp. SYSU D00382]